jgi:flagellin
MTTINGSDSKLAQASIARSSGELSAAVSNLVTGKRQDANVADFSVGTVLSTKVEVLRTATLNAGQAKSLLETAKGGLNTIVDLLTKQKNLATKASDDSLSDNERKFLNQEFSALTKEIDRIAANTNFNGKSLIDGSISGKATGATTTEETTENYSLNSVNQYRLAGTIASGNLDTTTTDDQAAASFDGTTLDGFAAVASTSIGTTRAETVIDLAYDHATTAVTTEAVANAAVIVGGVTVNVGSFNQTAGAANDLANGEAFATAAATALNASTDDTVRQFTYEASGSQVIVRAKDAGTTPNTVTFNVTKGAADTNAITLGTGSNGTDVDGANSTITAAQAAGAEGTTLGAVRTGTGTFDASLQGKITDISATYSKEGSEHRVTFTAQINGVTYTSNSIGLQDTGAATVIDAGQEITFYNANGTKDTSGNLTDSGFKLVVGSSDVTIAVTAGTATQIQNGLNTFSSDIETQLGGATIVQERSILSDQVSTTDNTLTGAVGTSLEGLKAYNETGNLQGSLRVRSDGFGSDGSFGSIGSFSYNKDTFKLTTTVDGVTYTADLSQTSDGTDNAVLNEGYGLLDNDGGSAVASGLLTVQSADAVQIVLHSETEGDGKQIVLELANNNANGGVGNGTTSDVVIDLSTDTAASNFASTLNKLFGVSASESLSFQVGSSSADSIGVSVGGATTSDLYKDDDGVTQTLSIGTLDGAKDAGDILDNAINSVISLISDVDAAISSFDSAISNNEASIQNADAARSVLLDTDYSTESTRFAEASVRFDAASSVLAQVNSRIQNLLQLLRF